MKESLRASWIFDNLNDSPSNVCITRCWCQAVGSALVSRDSPLRTATDHRPVPPSASPAFLSLTPGGEQQQRRRARFVYLLVDADGEDIPVSKRLLAEDKPVVELLDWLVAPGGSVRVRQADQLSAPRMQLRRHLQWAASIRDTLVCDSNLRAYGTLLQSIEFLPPHPNLLLNTLRYEVCNILKVFLFKVWVIFLISLL